MIEARNGGEALLSCEKYSGPLVFVETFCEHLSRTEHPELPNDELLEAVAFKNLKRDSKAALSAALDTMRQDHQNVMWTGEYDGLRALLLLPELMKADEEVFVLQVRRDSLLVLRAPADDNLQRHKDNAAATDIEIAPGMLTGLHRVSAKGFRAVE